MFYMNHPTQYNEQRDDAQKPLIYGSSYHQRRMTSKESFCFFFQAVARHSCNVLLNVHEAELLHLYNESNGHIPPLSAKIRRLDEINRILAHRPWAIKKQHIKVKINKQVKISQILT